MDMLALFFRTVLVYFVVFFTMRIMGKREIGKLSVFDLVISVMIAEIAVFVLEDLEKPIVAGVLPMLTLVAVQLLIAFVSLKNEKVRRIFEGKPSFIIKHGKLDRAEMKRQRYNLDDLLLQLRQSKVMDVANVEFAILESSGKLTVVEKEVERQEDSEKEKDKQKESQGAEQSDELSKIKFEGLPLPMIMDGKVQEDSLQKLDKTRFWLKSELQAKGVKDFKDVFYCSYDQRGRWFIDRKK
ncbi:MULTISPECIES: YetF domain-containing protein [unclassified Paenibacillus]|uniref:YetF domain-containing protein n=1 Tax=unclassified Paenibacillus TaxID=185978 RepID=UPI00363EA00A